MRTNLTVTAMCQCKQVANKCLHFVPGTLGEGLHHSEVGEEEERQTLHCKNREHMERKQR